MRFVRSLYNLQEKDGLFKYFGEDAIMKIQTSRFGILDVLAKHC